LSNKKFLSLSLILAFALVSGSAFASNLTERNVYGILSENFTGAIQESGYNVDNIRYYTWSEGGYTAPSCEYDVFAGAKEGKKYLDCTIPKGGVGGTGGWGGFCYQFVPSNNGANNAYKLENINHFRYLDFWIKPINGDLAHVQFGVTDVSGDKTKTLSQFGYTNITEGEWMHCVIDLTTLGADLTQIKNPFLVLGNNLSVQTNFYLDNIVLRTNNSSASFNATLKKIEDMQNVPENPTQISWKSSVFTSRGWKSCGQYLELDMDMYSWAWTVRMYTDNGGKGRGGMWAQGDYREYVIPMCWRAYNGKLVNEVGTNADTKLNKDTYLIAQAGAPDYNLYDYGKSPNGDPNYYPWMYFKDIADVDLNKPSDVDYITVWDSSLGGYHGFSSENPWEGFYSFDTVEKKPRIYFGGGFDDAAGDINYNGNIVVELNYE